MVSETPGSPIHQIRLFSKKSAFPLKKFSSRRKALFYLYFFIYTFFLIAFVLQVSVYHPLLFQRLPPEVRNHIRPLINSDD